MKKIIYAQFLILVCGTTFSWTNFAIELNKWLEKKPCSPCSVGLANPFASNCFYGAILFTITLILSFILLLKIRKK